MLVGIFGIIPLATAHPDIDPGIQRLTRELADDPDNIELLVRRGQSYRANGKFLESLADFERAWLLAPQNQSINLQRAMTLSALERYEDAEAALNVFLRDISHPQRVFGLAERAHIRARTGRRELAIDDLTAAIQFHPTVEMYLLRGELEESLGNLEAAAKGYYEGLAALGDAILLKKALIRVQASRGLYSEALGLVNEELERARIKTQWLLLQADILALQGQATAAQEARQNALTEANRILGKRQTALHLRARAEVYQAMGLQKEAERDLNRVIKQAPHLAEQRPDFLQLPKNRLPRR